MKDSAASTAPSDELLDQSNAAFSEAQRRLLVQRIVASACFVRSAFLTNFLQYVCDRQILGKLEEITEYQIGVQALGRSEDYNPGVDNIVRTYARILRKRLKEYFEGEGKDETLHLSIPRGGYVPIFHAPPSHLNHRKSEFQSLDSQDISGSLAADAIDDPQIIALPFAPTNNHAPRPRFPKTLLALAATLALAAIVFGMQSDMIFHKNLSHRFWHQIFNQSRQTLIVPADSSLGILENLTEEPINLADYVAGTYLSDSKSIPGIDPRNWRDLRTQRYTSVADLNIALSVSHLPEFTPDHSTIRYARDLRLEDLKHVNAIVLGSVHTNPWVELFQDQLNFALDYSSAVDDSFVLNRHPLPGESRVYKNAWADDTQRTYAVLAFIPSLDKAGNVLLLEGLNMAGTQGAADFLLNPRAIQPILRKALRKDGTICPFELLLETSSIGAIAPEARVVAERYGSDPTQ